MLFLFWENIWPLRSFCVEELEIILAPNSVLLTGLFLTEYSYNCVIFNWRVVNSRSWKSSCRKRFLADLIRGCLCECTRLGSDIRKSMSVLVAKSWTELQSIPEYAEYALDRWWESIIMARVFHILSGILSFVIFKCRKLQRNKYRICNIVYKIKIFHFQKKLFSTMF